MPETTSITEGRIDWKEVSDKLQNLLRLGTLPVGMKLFETVDEMEAIPKIRRPKKHHTTCQIVTQARQIGWTIGVTINNLIPGNCGAVIGLIPVPPDTLDGTRMAGVWFKDKGMRRPIRRRCRVCRRESTMPWRSRPWRLVALTRQTSHSSTAPQGK